MFQVDTLKWKAAFHTRPCASCARKVTTSVSTSAATVVIKRSKSKCMMAGAFTSELASHAKTEWPPVTKFGGKGETADGRMGESSALVGIRRRRCSRDELQTPCALAFRRPRFRNR